MPALVVLAPIPALAAALLAGDGSTQVLPAALLGITLELDKPGAMLLGASAVLWIAAGAYVRPFLRSNAGGGSFAIWWLMTLTGNIGVFLAADMVSFYLFFTLVSLAAYGLVAYYETPATKRAASVYIALTVLSEAFLLMGFVLLAAAHPNGGLSIREAMAALPTSSWRDPALALIILGFGMKIGLVPLHFWMPLTYSAAPIPAAAVLSGAAVKAGVIGLIRFLPFDAAFAGWGEALVAVGLVSAFYGVAIGITQANPKTVLAYSSVSQMGVLAAVLGMGITTGDRSVAILAAFYAVHHIFVKGGLFLAIGAAALTGTRRFWLVLVPAAVLALGLGGLPLSGGALAKLAVKAPLGDGIVGTLAVLSSIASTLLMVHFLRCLMRDGSHEQEIPESSGLLLPWLAIAIAAVVVPWVLYPSIGIGSLQDALTPQVLWAAFWPVLIGGILAVALGRWGYLLPRIPPGDVVAADKGTARATRNLGAVMENIEEHLRQWPVAGTLLLALAIILVGTMLAGKGIQ
ncbi:NADH/ubiquinone/plastoquinone (complex I) [Nordella sp. HKS 07]|nr:complex I subunit 5 family protein [Nordella sp. HKS 07]QIG50956.1 NADH/ubiquinone/plastoquinone (complex I) [Nordella sp. HKS 07]